MSYFRAKSELDFMLGFREEVFDLWQLEDPLDSQVRASGEWFSSHGDRQEAIQALGAYSSEYQGAREKVARHLPRACRIADTHKTPIHVWSGPMAALSRALPTVDVNLFESVLHDSSYRGVTRQQVADVLNQAIGACEDEVSQELAHLRNPLYWLKALLVFVLRIPFMIVEASGFDVGKIEDQLLGKVFKLVELALIIYLLLRLGVTQTQLLDIAKTWLMPK